MKTTKANKASVKKHAVDAPRGRNTFRMNPFDVVLLGVDTSDPPAESDLVMLLHKHRITKPLEKDMLDSISANGVEQAVTLAKLWLPAGMTLRGKTLKQDEQHLVGVDGRRRTLHLRELCRRAGDHDGTKNSFSLPVWSPKSGMTIRELAGLAIELNETGRHDDILEKAEQARIMFARTQDKAWVAAKFSVDPVTVDGWFKLRADAAPAVLEAVKTNRGGINATGATKLTRLPPAKQLEVMEEQIAKGDTSTKAIDAAVKKKLAEAKGIKPSEQPNRPPSKRKLAAALAVIRDGELDFDEFMAWHQVANEIITWVRGDGMNKRITELDRKAEEYMKRKPDMEGSDEDMKAVAKARAERAATMEKE